jgi:integrase
MARPKKDKPDYCKDKSSGRAFVTLNGERKYLGKHGTRESRDEYDRVIGEWIATGRQLVPDQSEDEGITVSSVIAAFWMHAQTYYRHPDGTPTSEVENIRQALRPLRRLYAASPAGKFGPLALEALQREMIKLGWARTNINRHINRVRLVFRWAASKQMIPASVHHGLVTVPGLRAGRSDANESERVRPVPDAILAATLPHLGRHVRAMVDLQLLTGARAGEIVTMRTCDINRTGKVWVYTPVQHKTQHHGHAREIRFGPKAQKILEPFLKPNLAAFMFSPAEAEAERLEKLHAQRKTPMNEGNKPGPRRRKFSDRYSVAAYRIAIRRACEAAFKMPAEYCEPRTKDVIDAESKLPDEERKARKKDRQAKRSEWRDQHVWHPHMLRHNSATLLRRQYGIEAARLILGHRSAAVTEIYAEMDAAKAEQIMGEVG